jgi:hypothetical protein
MSIKLKNERNAPRLVIAKTPSFLPMKQSQVAPHIKIHLRQDFSEQTTFNRICSWNNCIFLDFSSFIPYPCSEKLHRNI